MAGILWAVVILLLALWVLAKLIFGIVGTLFHLLLVAAVVRVVCYVIRAGAARGAQAQKQARAGTRAYTSIRSPYPGVCDRDTAPVFTPL